MKRFAVAAVLSAAVAGCGQSPAPQADFAARADASEPSVPSPAAAVPSPVSPPPEASPVPAAPTVPYEQLVESGEQAIQAGQLNEAASFFTQAIRQDPKRSQAYARRAAVLAEARMLTPAVNDMSAAIQLDPNNPKLHNTRGYFLLLLKQYDRADADFSAAIGLDLRYAQPYNNRGLIAVARGEHEQAITDFDNALRVDAEYLDAHNNRGFALVQLGRNEEAAESFTQALNRNPDYINALVNRARVWIKLDRPADALNDLDHAIQLQPDHLHHYSLRAEVYQLLGQEQAALADAEHVAWGTRLAELNQKLQKQPRNTELWNELGQHLLTRNRDNEARAALDQALTIHPNHLPSLLGRAHLSMRSGNLEGVIADCTTAIEAGELHEARSLRGDAYSQLGRWNEAIADYTAARRFDPGVVAAYRRRAEELRSAGRSDQALADEKLAADLEKSLSETASRGSGAPRAMIVEQANHEEPATGETK